MRGEGPISPEGPRRRRNLDKFRPVYRDTASSIIVSLVAQLALLVSGVLVARMLGVPDRGRLALLLLFSTVVTQLGSLGMPLALTYWIAQEPGAAPGLVRSLFGFVARQVLLTVVTQAVLLYLVLGQTAGYERTAALISLVSTPATIGWQYGLSILQGQRRFVAFNLCRLTFPIVYAGVVAGLYVANVHGLSIVVVSWTVAMWLAAGGALCGAMRGLRPTPEETAPFPGRRTMLRFGVRSLLGSVSPLETFQLDQAVVGLFISPAALGIYVVAVALTNLPRFIAQSIGLVAYPNIAARTDRTNLRRTIAAIALAVLVLAGGGVVLLEVALPWLVPRLFGDAFAPSVSVARILLIAALLVGLRRVLGDCARGAGRPGLSTVDELSALVCLFPALALLVEDGVQGVAVAMLISAGVGLVVITVGLIVATGDTDSRSLRGMHQPIRRSPVQPDPSVGALDSSMLPIAPPSATPPAEP